MGWTKRAFVTAAFTEIGIASWDIALPAEQVVWGAQRLDAMMADWNGRGIRIGYQLDDVEDTDLDAQTGVPDWANRAIILNLAIELAPNVGRTPMQSTITNASIALSTVNARTTSMPLMQMPGTMPAGQGNRGFGLRSPFLDPPADLIAVGDDGILDFD